MTMSATASIGVPPADPQRAALYLRVFGGDLGLAQVWFDQRVLDRYRAEPGTRVMRTNTVGRVRSASGWSLDCGIADDAKHIGPHLLHSLDGAAQGRPGR